VLPVVDQLAGLAIGECGRAPAKPAACLEDEDAASRFRESRGRRDPGDTGADNRDIEPAVWRHYRPVSAVRAQVAAAMSARRGRGTRMTPLNTS